MRYAALPPKPVILKQHFVAYSPQIIHYHQDLLCSRTNSPLKIAYLSYALIKSITESNRTTLVQQS
jgi:hypothetical protein